MRTALFSIFLSLFSTTSWGDGTSCPEEDNEDGEVCFLQHSTERTKVSAAARESKVTCSATAYCNTGNDVSATSGRTCGPYTSESFTDTCNCIDTIHVTAGCSFEAATESNGAGQKELFNSNAGMSSTLGYDRVRSIRVFREASKERAAPSFSPGYVPTECQRHISWAAIHGKKYYSELQQVTGVSSTDGTIEDFQRYFKCRNVGKGDCNDKGLQFPVTCSRPPCNKCSSSDDSAEQPPPGYIPGQAGSKWSAEEIQVVKAKLNRIFENGGGVMMELKEEDREGWEGMPERYTSTPNAPRMLRLSFHDCMRYQDGTGGCDGCLHWDGMRTRYDRNDLGKYKLDPAIALDGGHNNGLQPTVQALEGVYTQKAYPSGAPWLNESLKSTGKSRADLWALAGITAVEWGISLNNYYCDDPQNSQGKPKQCQYGAGEAYCKVEPERPIAFLSGREDCITNEDKPYKAPQTSYEAAPPASGNGAMVVQYFSKNFGYTARETAAIMGAHTFGRVAVTHSLFRYGWTSRNQFLFNNHYYRNMVKKEEWLYDDDTCTPVGDAFGHKARARWVPHVRHDTTRGGPVQWLNEKLVCKNCKRQPSHRCCTDLPPGLKCQPDNGRQKSEDPDNNVNGGCESFRFISGVDETMLNSDLGLYLDFKVDDDGAPSGCTALKDFKYGKWDTYANTWPRINGKKAEPECPLNRHADPGDKPLHEIIESYADSSLAWITDFIPAFEKMMSNGYAANTLRVN